MASLGELFVDLLIDTKQGQMSIKELVSGIGDLSAATLGEIGVLSSLAYKLAEVADEAMRTAVSFQTFENQTGLSSQELQRWQVAAQQANVSAESVASSVTALQKNLAMIRLGQGNISPFQILGINPNGDAFSVLEQVRQRIRGLNPALATNLISQMGLTPDMINVLRLSNAEFARFAATARGLSSRETRGFLDMKRELVTMGLQLRDLSLSSGLVFKPLVDDVAALVRTMHDVPEASRVVAAAFGIIAAAIFPITAAVVGLLLILEDFSVYMRGGKSLIGEFIKDVDQFTKHPIGAAVAHGKTLAAGAGIYGSLLPSAVIGNVPASVAAAIGGLAKDLGVEPHKTQVTVNIHDKSGKLGHGDVEVTHRDVNAADLQIDN